ncbi:MAG: hypothetical protein QOJ54_2139 [Aliidongia sp.]|jgi:hypothetical protein|nr:hypothetical protein [Aliidongia sp.]
MAKSLFLEGVLAEEADAARAHVWTFDHATVFGEVRRRVTNGANTAPIDPIRHARDDDLILPIEPNDWRAAKLSRILWHLDLRFESPPTEAELVDLCLRAETRAVDLLVRLEGPKNAKKGSEPFSGGSVLDLSRFVVRRMFEQLDESFTRKPIGERERIAEDIAQRLATLPEEVRERIRIEAGLANLSAEALMRTGSLAAVGGAMVGTVGLAGFAAYTSVTSFIAAAAGIIGLTLPFGVYTFATSTLAFVSNPVIVGSVALLGGHFAIKRATQQMRDRLVPVMVATAVIAATATDVQKYRPAAIAKLLETAASNRGVADSRGRSQIERTFPALPKIK